MATETPPIKLLRPGTFTDIHGQRVTLTHDDLVELASSYDRDADPAPLVIGHPKHDDPAWGWVGGLAMQGDDLVAAPADIEPAFAEAVGAKRYRKVSASYWPRAHPGNPKPGKLYLKHVGFLGAAAPAVKGLGTVAFSDADDASSPTIISNEEDPLDEPTDPVVALTERDATISTLQAELATMRADAERRDREAADAARAAQHGENVAFADALIASATLAPAAKDRVVGVMDQLSAVEVVAFGEGEAAQMTPLAAFRSLFDGAQPVVALGEAAPADRAGPATVVVSFSAPPGYSAADADAALHARAKAIQAATPGLPFWDAFVRARGEAAS